MQKRISAKTAFEIHYHAKFCISVSLEVLTTVEASLFKSKSCLEDLQ